MLNIFMSARNVLIWKQDRWAFGLWKWCLCLVLILYTHEFDWKFLWLLIPKFINEHIYCHGTGRISNCLQRLLHKVLGCAPAIILTIFFCKVRIFPMFKDLPPRIIPYFITEWKYAYYIDKESWRYWYGPST